MKALVIFVFLFELGLSSKGPLRGCPQTKNSYFISDPDDRCIYYWCVGGQFVLPQSFKCAPGSGTAYGYEGYDNPCTERVSKCKGGQGQKPPYTQNNNHYDNHVGDDYGFYNGETERPQYPVTPETKSTGTYFSDFGISEIISKGDASGHSGIQSGQANRQIATAVNYHGDHGSITITVHGVQADGEQSVAKSKENGGKPKTRIVYKLDGFHVPDGSLQPDLYDATSCLHACVDNSTCHGFDFNFRDQTCWFHGAGNVCDNAQPKDYCSHYRFQHCPKTTPGNGGAPTVPSTPVTPPSPGGPGIPPGGGIPPFEAFEGMCVAGGQFSPLYTSETDCQSACILDINCQGVDFDRAAGGCYMHMGESVCGVLMPREGCNHYRFVQCPAGTVMAFPGAHALGGTLQTGITDPTECIMACQGMNGCVAIDYDSRTASCWFHDVTTCMNMVAKEACVHIRLQNCG